MPSATETSASTPPSDATRVVVGPHGGFARVLWILLLLVGLVLFGWQMLQICFFPNRNHVIDFYQEWSSARSWWVGDAVYQPTRLTRLRDFPGIDPESPWLLGYNVHPPTSVLISLPLGKLPYFEALIAWNAVCLAALLTSWLLISRNRAAPWSAGTWIVLFALLLWGNPFWQQIRLGQLNPVLLLCLVLGWNAAERGRSWTAGFWFGWAAAIKLFPAFVGLYFLFRRDWKTLLACIVWGLLISGVTYSVLGQQTIQDYVRHVMPEALDWRSSRTNASLTGLCYKLFDPGPQGGKIQPLIANPWLAKAAIAASWCFVLGLLIDAIRRIKSASQANLAFGMTLVAMLLLSPVTWEHYFLLLPGALAAIWSRLPPRFGLRAWYLFGLTLLMVPVYAWVNHYLSAAEAGAGLTPREVLGIPSLYCYGLLILLVLGWVGAKEQGVKAT